jgi:hypothetical protein
MNLTFDTSINPNGPIKSHDALEVRPLPQKGKVFAVLFGLLAPFFRCPHDRLLRFFPTVHGLLPHKE